MNEETWTTIIEVLLAAAAAALKAYMDSQKPQNR